MHSVTGKFQVLLLISCELGVGKAPPYFKTAAFIKGSESTALNGVLFCLFVLFFYEALQSAA